MAHKNQPARITAQEALQFHAQGKPGKLEITPTKPLATQRDLSLAYSPGRRGAGAKPSPRTRRYAYDYTNKGNLVAVVSNGTAILGLGNLGALASKPVMEGKGALFKRFADIDAIDLLVDTEDVDAFINCVRYLGPSFGGINLEDIKAPDCFIIEEKLKELLDIPVFHDDQHGTAIIAAAGLLNALELTGRTIENFKLVVNGAGAAGIACLDLLGRDRHAAQERHFLRHEGRHLPGPQGRHEPVEVGLSRPKTKARTLAEALDGADVFFGLSAKGAVHRGHGAIDGAEADHLRHGKPRPRDHAGRRCTRCDPTRSWPRADRTTPTRSTTSSASPSSSAARSTCRRRTINDAMKIAATEGVGRTGTRGSARSGRRRLPRRRPTFGPDYIIPAPFDPRLITHVPPAVAKAAMESGVARTPIVDMDAYVARLEGPSRSRRRLAAVDLRHGPRTNPSASSSPRARTPP